MSNELSIDILDMIEFPNDEKCIKLELKKLKNRVSAQNSRNKKNLYIKSLEEENQRLRVKVLSLTNELNLLK